MNDWRDTPEPSLEPPEPKVLYHCCYCNSPICAGDPYYYIRGHRYCEECIEDCAYIAEE